MTERMQREYTGYKANLLQNARYQMKQSGGKVRVANQHVTFWAADGRKCSVWFPFESRVSDSEIVDLKYAIKEMSGHAAFTL